MNQPTLFAATALVAAGVASPAIRASAQVPVPVELQPVPFKPSEIREEAYPTLDFGNPTQTADDKNGSTTWRIVEGTGNCCENYLTSAPNGRLYDFGGTYVNYTDDRGLTWFSVRPVAPLVNGEGTIAMAPGGDVVGVGWDPYSGDHLQSFKYEAESGTWHYAELPLHQPFYDREWVTSVPGPFTIDGQTVEYITFLKGGWPSKELWYYSTDGLIYRPVESKLMDKILSDAPPQVVTTSSRKDADWIQPNTNGGMTPLGDRGLLASADYPESATRWSLFDGETWVPAAFADGTTPSGLFQVDSLGRLHNVLPKGGELTYRWSSDQGASWDSLVVPLPGGTVVEEIDFRASYAAGVAAVLVHAQDTVYGGDIDVLYKIGIGPKYETPTLLRRHTLGRGDVDSTAGLGSNVRMDFQTVAILPDGRVAVSYLDSTTNTFGVSGNRRVSPAVAIETTTKITGPAEGPADDDEANVGTAQSPMTGAVVVAATGAGQRVAPVTSAYFEFISDASADNGGGVLVQATPVLPADIDLYLQRQLPDGSWSSDLASGTSGSLTDESMQAGRLLPGARYRVDVHNWAGPPNQVALELTFFNSANVAGP